MKHDDVWRGIDTLAAERGLTASGLAKAAGLDPTAFNLSKRKIGGGRLRWPSTETLAKIFEITGIDLGGFSELVYGARAVPSGQRSPARRIPLIGLAQAGGDGYFDDGGYPVGGSWDEVGLPEISDPHAYALEISGESMEPVFRDGDLVARTVRGEVMAKQLARRSARRVELRSLNPLHPDFTFDLAEVTWIHRIVWASQ
jgi:phage repressor protein C with HTH and peptisase S24 domain